jgi:hypothetical protein
MDLSDEAIACHEAGHAIMAALCDRPICWVYIGQDNQDDSAGKVRFYNDCPPEYNARSNRSSGKRRNLLTMAAGTVAHGILKPDRTLDCGDNNDREEIRDLIIQCAWWAQTDRHRELYLNLVYAKARAEIEQHWPWVQAVAAALIERRKLNGEEVLNLKQ